MPCSTQACMCAGDWADQARHAWTVSGTAYLPEILLPSDDSGQLVQSAVVHMALLARKEAMNAAESVTGPVHGWQQGQQQEWEAEGGFSQGKSYKAERGHHGAALPDQQGRLRGDRRQPCGGAEADRYLRLHAPVSSFLGPCRPSVCYLDGAVLR